ncbi:MAG: hypothetical protein KC431_11845, partial [Myxococcales bacterium]|nr:hypothetical protein [Myxococcales bacterium]
GAGAAAEASWVQLGTERMADARNARAFFLGASGRLEFDALEVLRAASRAEGIEDPPQTDHPNYLQFCIEGADEDGGEERRFPSLDQSMRWLWHRTARIRQQEAVEVDLRRAVATLFAHPGSERERDRVIARLLELTAAELALAFDWETRSPSESEFDRVVGWSDRFFVGLLREFATGEALLRRRGPGHLGMFLPGGRQPWFFPPSEHPQWTAWALVVEIALRRMIACWQGVLDDWTRPTPLLAPALSHRPAVSFSQGSATAPSTPRALAITLTGLDRRAAPSRIRGAFVGRVHHWRLRGSAIPWWSAEQPPPAGTPGAASLWAWAAHEQPSAEMIAALPMQLGIVRSVESGFSRPLRVA